MATPHRAIFAIGLMLLAGALASCAQWDSIGELPRGDVKAFIVNGDVKIMGKNGKLAPLAKGQIFQDGNTVIAGPDGMALLVFSNGALVRVTPHAQLEITRYRQAPFDRKVEGAFLTLTRDPSRSETVLYLNNGTVQGEIKTLDRAAGSMFVVNTPGGFTDIIGTIFDLRVIRDATDRVTSVIASCFVGNMGFTPRTGAPSSANTNGARVSDGQNQNVANGSINIPAAAQIAIVLDVNALGQVSGFNAIGFGIAALDSNALLNDVYWAVNTARVEIGLTVIPPPPVSPPSFPTSAAIQIDHFSGMQEGAMQTPVSLPLPPE